MKESLALTQATLDATADGLLVVGNDDKIKMFNTRFVELTQAPEDVLVSGDDALLKSDAIRHVRNPDQFRDMIAKIDRHPEQKHLDIVEFMNGKVLEQSCQPCILDDHIVGRVLSFRDITERFKTQKQQETLIHQAAEANEELTHFAYVVSHDLKAPLRGIKLLTDWFCTDYADRLGHEAAEQLTLLQNRVQRMHNLIEGVLQYSRIGRVQHEAMTIELNELVENIVDAIAPPEHIQVTIQEPLPIITGEKTCITQVFQNLLSNAVKYMDKPQGQITVACDDGPDAWTFSVSDNGPGIEAKHFERIFQIFQTLVPKDEYESTGVGLTLVKKIVEHHGGRVWVESEIGQGSRFVFTLPKKYVFDSSASQTEHIPTAVETTASRKTP